MRTISLPHFLSRTRSAPRPLRRPARKQRSTGEDPIRTAEFWSAEASAPGRPRLKSTNL